jgi:glutamate synthase domain-containing protein 2
LGDYVADGPQVRPAVIVGTGFHRAAQERSQIAAAVGNQIEVLFDGGIRRGGDVVITLALGARAVLLGRAHLWGPGGPPARAA